MSSVLGRFRHEEDTDFIYMARLLAAKVAEVCINTKKGRYNDLISVPAVQCAGRVYEFVKKGNSIIPRNQHEAQLRRDQFIMAKAELEVLDSKVGMAHEFYHFKDHDLNELGELLDSEHNLVKGIIESDRKRFRNLPNWVGYKNSNNQ